MAKLNRTALITGASAGLGATFARHLAAEGYDLILVARRADALSRIASEVGSKYGVAVETMVADLTRDDDCAAVGQKLASTERLALLVNNAGFGTRGLFFEADAARQDEMYRLHVLATERLTRAALPGMVARRQGGVINVASVAGFLQAQGAASYSSTKAWMISFSEGLHVEMKAIRSPVVVQALCPGFTYTEFHDVAGVDRYATMGKSWWMQADDVVGASVRALKTGKLIVVPGGRYKALVAASRIIPRGLFLSIAGRVRAGRRNL